MARISLPSPNSDEKQRTTTHRKRRRTEGRRYYSRASATSEGSRLERTRRRIQYLADAALRLKSDLDKEQPAPTTRLLGDPPSSRDADAFCRNTITMQSGAPARAITGAALLLETPLLREKLKEKIKPIDEEPEKENALLQLRHRRLHEMQARVTPDMVHALDEQLEKHAVF